MLTLLAILATLVVLWGAYEFSYGKDDWLYWVMTTFAGVFVILAIYINTGSLT